MEPHDRTGESAVEHLPAERTEEAVVVLCDSFRDYPVFPYVIGGIGDEYDKRLRTLIGFFVAARFYRDEPVLAVSDAGRAVAVAILTPPVRRDAPAELAEHRETVWGGNSVRGRGGATRHSMNRGRSSWSRSPTIT